MEANCTTAFMKDFHVIYLPTGFDEKQKEMWCEKQQFDSVLMFSHKTHKNQ